jgi:spermidine/putrescine transport system permease protein
MTPDISWMNKPWLERTLGRGAVSWPPTLYLIVFFLVPTLIMVVASLRYPGEYGGLAPLLLDQDGKRELNLTLDSYQRLGEDPVYLELFVKSFVYALLTTVICLAAAYPLALAIARSAKKYRDLLLFLVILPFWSNFLIRVYAWMIILGPQAGVARAVNAVLEPLGLGPISLLYNPFAVMMGLVYVHLPFMILPLYANLEKHDPTLLDAAQDCGAKAWQRFWRITFVLSLPGVFAGSALVFIPAFGAFAVPDILGGTNGIMIGNLISQQFLIARDWPFGSALSVVLTLVAIAVAALAALFARGKRFG